jgi:hypothetical protein
MEGGLDDAGTRRSRRKGRGNLTVRRDGRVKVGKRLCQAMN